MLQALLGAEFGQYFQRPLACGVVVLRIWRRGRRALRGGAGGFGRVELNLADIQILLEAVELQEIGELESSDIPASLPNLPLEVTDDFLEIGFGEAGVEELIPEPFPIKAQAHALAGEAAVERVSLWNTLDHEV